MGKIEAVRYLKELGKDATLEDGVVMLRSRATGAALDRECKAMKKDLKAAGYNGSLGIPTQGFKTCFICGRHLAMNRIPIVISVSGKGNRFACDKCYEKSQREKEHEKTEL